MNEDEAFDFLIEHLIAFQTVLIIFTINLSLQDPGKMAGLKVQDF